MFGEKLDTLLHKTLHSSHKCHTHHHIDHNDARDTAETNNNFPGANPRPVFDTDGQATNEWTGMNPRQSPLPDGNNNFPGLSPTANSNNFPGTNPRSWADRHPESGVNSCVTSDNESESVGSGVRRPMEKKWYAASRKHESEREEEDGNNFPGMNPAKPKKKSAWSLRNFEESNNFPGCNPHSRW